MRELSPMKRCPRCGRDKFRSEFGTGGYCQSLPENCQAAYQRERYAARKEENEAAKARMIHDETANWMMDVIRHGIKVPPDIEASDLYQELLAIEAKTRRKRELDEMAASLVDPDYGSQHPVEEGKESRSGSDVGPEGRTPSPETERGGP